MTSTQSLLSFAVRAATLDERLSDSFEALPGSKNDCDASARRIAAWCRHAASGDWIEFIRHLHRDSKSLDTILPRLTRIDLRPGAAWFDWLQDAQWIADALAEDPCQECAGVHQGDDALPFDDLFRGLVHRALERRDQLIGADIIRAVPRHVLAAGARNLRQSVTSLCEEVLYDQFRQFRADRHADAEPATHEMQPHGSSPIYRAFVARLRSGALKEVFNTYPVLLRLIASATRQWIDTSVEFTLRLHNDLPVIREHLIPGAVLADITSIDTGLSDVHNAGRSVCVITFSDGRSVVYKPRDVVIDKRWNDLIRWLNSRHPPLDLRGCDVVPRDGYGWSEYIDHCDAEDKTGLVSFFNRAGGLLALCYLFNGKDMHHENLIAAGDHPVLIDLEMLFQPSAARGLADGPAWHAQNLASARLDRSVLATGLIPTWLPTASATAVIVGGLHAPSADGLRRRVWRYINSDQMAPVWIDRTNPSPANLPGCQHESVSLTAYAREVVEGCEQYLRFLLANKHEVLRATDSFSGVHVRRVLKPTQFYDLLINRLRDYRNMSDGAEWSANLAFLSRFASGDDIDASNALASAERDQLGRLNIPYFCQRTDQDYMRGSLGTVSARTEGTPIAAARQTITDFDDQELRRQMRLLRVSLSVLGGGPALVERKPHRGPLANETDLSTPTSRSVVTSIAGSIATQLRDMALQRDGSASWTGLRPMAGDLAWQFSVLGSDLYSGTPGIAVFLSACSKVMPDQGWRDLALAALAPWRYILRSSSAAHFARLNGIGGVAGMGSLVYALTTISEILEEPDIQDDALVASSLITSDLIHSDESFDVIGGAAGAILGLLKLYRFSQSTAVLERALLCGQHLLQQRPSRDICFGMWPQPNGLRLTGFSHGAAGFAYALSSLAPATGELVFADAAKDCLLYERQMYSAEHGNWKDLRYAEDGKPTYCCQWCHGAAGIALARIGMLKVKGAGSEVLDDIRAAIGTVRRSVISDIDTPCCGNMGRVEALLEAAPVLGAAGLADDALAMARLTVDRARDKGGFGWIAGGDSENPGMFGGLAGLGYSFLRCIYPERLPCVLMLE